MGKSPLTMSDCLACTHNVKQHSTHQLFQSHKRNYRRNINKLEGIIGRPHLLYQNVVFLVYKIKKLNELEFFVPISKDVLKMVLQ